MKNKYSYLFQSQIILLILIIILIAILYTQTLFHNLIFLDDDTLVYTKFQGMGLFEKISLSFTSNYLGGHYYRPVTLMSFAMDSIFGKHSHLIYHLTNLLIHIFTSVFIFLSFRKLGYSLIIAFSIVLLFALNPININAIGWIAGRGDLLAAFFSTAALFIFLKFLKQNKLVLLILVSFLLFLAFLSKEVSLLVPFLFLVVYFLEKKELLLNKNSIGVLLMIVVVFCLYYLLRGVFLSGVHIDKFSFTDYYKNIFVLPETISKFFIPTGIKALPSIESFTSISGTIIFVLFLLLPYKATSIDKYKYYFGLLWFVLLLIPGMVFRTMEQDGFYYWDCRTYLPSIGLLFMVAEIVRVIKLQKYSKQFIALATIYILILGAFTFIKIKIYENPITFWSSVKTDYPSSYLPYLGLFNYYNHVRDLNNSEKQLVSAIKISPKELIIRESLVNFYLTHSETEKGFAFLTETLIDEKIYSAVLIEKYISLCIQMQRFEELDNLYNLYLEDETSINKIKEIILKKEKLLGENGDSLNSHLLFEKIKRLN